MLGRHAVFGVIGLILALCACTSPGAVGSSAPSPTVSPSSIVSASLSVSASPSVSAAAGGASASTTTACLARAIYSLFPNVLGAIDTLSAQQRSDIVAALEAYNFGTNPTALSWRDYVIAALKTGSFPSQPIRDTVITQFLAGQSGLKPCP
jgi:hypothetical protein